MEFPAPVAAFWQAYLATRRDAAPPRLDPDPLWRFGDTDEDATVVGQLALTGVKTATSSLVWEYEAEGAAFPQPGDLAIVVDGAGLPLCVIELSEVVVRPFNAVDEAFAYDYGEYGRTLGQWRVASWQYFAGCCADLGLVPSETMPLLCLRFRRVYPSNTGA